MVKCFKTLKVIIILFPFILGTLSLFCGGISVRNHAISRRLNSEIRRSVSEADYYENDDLYQCYKRERYHEMTLYSSESISDLQRRTRVLAISAVIAAFISLPNFWYAGLPEYLEIFPGVNLIIAFISLFML